MKNEERLQVRLSGKDAAALDLLVSLGLADNRSSVVRRLIREAYQTHNNVVHIRRAK